MYITRFTAPFQKTSIRQSQNLNSQFSPKDKSTIAGVGAAPPHPGYLFGLPEENTSLRRNFYDRSSVTILMEITQPYDILRSTYCRLNAEKAVFRPGDVLQNSTLIGERGQPSIRRYVCQLYTVYRPNGLSLLKDGRGCPEEDLSPK